MQKSTVIAVLAGIRFLTCVCAVSANEAGFVTTDKGVQYDTGDGSYIVNSWVQDADLNWYHFDEEGVMQTAWYQDANGAYYWLDETGKMIYDTTYTIQGKTYTFASDGSLLNNTLVYSFLPPLYTTRFTYIPFYQNNTMLRQSAFTYLPDMKLCSSLDTANRSNLLVMPREVYHKRASNEVLQLDTENLSMSDENETFTGIDPVKTQEELEMEQLADQIVNQLVTEDMTKKEKATAIYQWIQSHIGYIATSDKSDWVAEAIRGLKTRRGDCFTYFSVARAMLDAAGIENLSVYPKEGCHVHYWNLVNVEGGWYHFDTTPRKSGATFCIVTNEQYDALSNARYTTKYLENGMTYPEMAAE